SDRTRQGEHRGVDCAKGRCDQVLLPALGDARLAGQQRAEILESDPVRVKRKQDNRNAEGRGTPPPTHKRNCSPLTQRNTAKSCAACRRVATMRQIFYEPINLAKALTPAERAQHS